MNRFFLVEILSAEAVHNLIRGNFALLFGNLLNDIGKFLVHRLGQLKAKISVHNVSENCAWTI